MPEILADLQARGLVETTDGLRPVRPFVRVGLCNFWPSFNRQDNFFAWMLLDKFDVLLVDAQQDEADFVFYSTFPSAGFDHAQVDRTRTPKVCFSNENHPRIWTSVITPSGDSQNRLR